MTRALFPKLSVYKSQWIKVDEIHQLYVEQSGNPNGIPVVYLHGGPGAGSTSEHRRYFDPSAYRIIVFDQRGCGKSTPSPSIENNTTTELIADIEKIRKYLNIDQWLLTGGSWGSTLALAYGIAHANVVLGFILRGVFLGQKTEYDWLYKQSGVSSFFPEYYREFVAQLPFEEKDNPLIGYYHQVNGDNEVAAIAASKAWYLWELRLSTVEHHHISMAQVDDPHRALCIAQISTHYFSHHCFMPERFILDNISKIRHLPAILLHGRYDMVCQVNVAWSLAQLWENAQLQILPFAGHSGFESQTIDAFCKATDTMADFLKQKT